MITIHGLPPVVFEEGRALAFVGWIITIHGLPPVVFREACALPQPHCIKHHGRKSVDAYGPAYDAARPNVLNTTDGSPWIVIVQPTTYAARPPGPSASVFANPILGSPSRLIGFAVRLPLPRLLLGRLNPTPHDRLNRARAQQQALPVVHERRERACMRLRERIAPLN